MNKEFCIGTAQFGQAYGLNSTKNNIQLLEASKILNSCNDNNIHMIDTAIAYGDSESILGKCELSPFRISTKFSINDLNGLNVNTKTLIELITGSLKRMNITKIENLFLHSSADLLSNNASIILECIQELKEQKKIQNFGVSIYSPNELKRILDLTDIQIIQAPVNFYDRRFISKSVTTLLNKNDVKLQARSIFLQGLLLKSIKELPPFFYSWKSELRIWHNLLKNNKLSPLDACIKFILQQSPIASVVFGVDNFSHFNEILKSIKSQNYDVVEFPFLDFFSKELIDPRKW